MQQKVAITNANSPLAEAILEKISESGITPDSLVLLDDESFIGTRIGFGGKHLVCQDQSVFDYSSVDVVLLTARNESLESRIAAENALVVSHLPLDDSSPIYLADKETELDCAYSQKIFKLADVEVATLTDVLKLIDAINPVTKLHITAIRSAEMHGKAAIDELAGQTVDLLSGRDVTANVYAEQIAFNLIPSSAQDSVSREIHYFFPNLLSKPAFQIIDVAAFHGIAISVGFESVGEIFPLAIKKQLETLPGVEISELIVSPVTHCNQSFSCIVSQFKAVEEKASTGSFWLVSDPLRYGLARNYVNVTGFLLNSFL
ncbi:MAG: aspartate-semialdehyde dehydrogenase [Gammaproteobacteria bacterium]|jgi:aspartate-semialdehyde dehydrogenase